MDPRTEAKIAADYNKSRDLTGFDPAETVPITVKRNVTISVRFSEKEITELRARAEQAGMKVTSFIRAAALEASQPIDRVALVELLRDVERRAHQVVDLVTHSAELMTDHLTDRLTEVERSDDGPDPRGS